eukprot:1824024-Prymnesium_polylepis.1
MRREPCKEGATESSLTNSIAKDCQPPVPGNAPTMGDADRAHISREVRPFAGLAPGTVLKQTVYKLGGAERRREVISRHMNALR